MRLARISRVVDLDLIEGTIVNEIVKICEILDHLQHKLEKFTQPQDLQLTLAEIQNSRELIMLVDQLFIDTANLLEAGMTVKEEE